MISLLPFFLPSIDVCSLEKKEAIVKGGHSPTPVTRIPEMFEVLEPIIRMQEDKIHFFFLT